MNTRDVDTVLTVVLADDLREQLERASTLPPPPPALYVEVPFRLTRDDGSVVALTVGGRVRGGEVRCFSAEDPHGAPVRIPDSQMPAALHELVTFAAEGWREPEPVS